MAQKQVMIRGDGKKILMELAARENVSQQGLLEALVKMANGEAEHLGIIDIDWDRLRRTCPSPRVRQKRSWEKVIRAVDTLMEETTDPVEISRRSRFSIAQVERAMKELS